MGTQCVEFICPCCGKKHKEPSWLSNDKDYRVTSKENELLCNDCSLVRLDQLIAEQKESDPAFYEYWFG